MSSKQDDLKKIELLTGSGNYHAWATDMTGSLLYKGWWRVVTGEQDRPEYKTREVKVEAKAATDKTPAVAEHYRTDIISTTEQQAAIDAAQILWDERDDHARGLIMTNISRDLHHHCHGTSSFGAWEALKQAYHTPTNVAIYNMFIQSIRHSITKDRDPGPQIEALAARWQRLESVKIRLPAAIKNMALLGSLDNAYPGVVQSLLQADDVPGWEAIKNGVQRVYNHKHGAAGEDSAAFKRSNKPRAEKLSAVKQKGPDPIFDNQHDHSHSGPSYRGRGNGRDRGRGGRGGNSNQERGRTRGGKKVQQKKREAYFASLLGPGMELTHENAPSPFFAERPSTVVTTLPAGLSFRKTKVQPAAAQQAEDSLYPSVQLARDNLNALEMRKTASHMEVMEKIANERLAKQKVPGWENQTIPHASIQAKMWSLIDENIPDEIMDTTDDNVIFDKYDRPTRSLLERLEWEQTQREMMDDYGADFEGNRISNMYSDDEYVPLAKRVTPRKEFVDPITDEIIGMTLDEPTLGSHSVAFIGEFDDFNIDAALNSEDSTAFTGKMDKGKGRAEERDEDEISLGETSEDNASSTGPVEFYSDDEAVELPGFRKF